MIIITVKLKKDTWKNNGNAILKIIKFFHKVTTKVDMPLNNPNQTKSLEILQWVYIYIYIYIYMGQYETPWWAVMVKL